MKKVFRKSTSLILALAMLCTVVFANTVFAGSEPEINMSTATCSESTSAQTVSVDVSLANNPGIIAMRLRVGYDSTYLKLSSVVDAGVFGTKYHGNDVTANPYVLCWGNDDAAENFVVNETIVTLNFEVAANTPTGTYPITITYDNNNDDIYDLDIRPVEFTVNNGGIEVTEKPKENFTGLSIEDKTVTYDGTAQTIEVEGAPTDATVEYTYTKVVEGNDTVDKAIDAGTYKVTATVSKEGYNNWEDTATLTINKKALTLKGVEVADKVYDGTVEATVANQGTVEGLADADKDNEGKFTYGVNTATFADKNVGTDKAVSLEVSHKGTSAGNYTMTAPTDVKANITKKAITVTAKDVTAKVNSTMEDVKLTYTVEGLVDGDTLKGALAVDGKVDFSKVGEYNIVKGDLDAGTNYDLTFVGAKLKVIDKTPQTITVASVDAKTYGDAAFALTVTADETSKLSAFKYASSDEKVATVDANGQVTIVGAGKATITVTEPGNADYAEATATAELTVAPKAITVTAVNMTADPKTATLEGVVGEDDVTVDFTKSVAIVTNVAPATITIENDAITTTFAFIEFKLKGNAAKNYVVSKNQPEITYTTTEKTKTETAEDGTIITTVPAGDKTVVVPTITVGAQATEVKIEAPKAVSMPKTEFDKIDVPLTIALKDGADDKGSIVLDTKALEAISNAATTAIATQISTSMKADVAVDDLAPAQQTKVAEVSAKTPKVYSLSVVDENGASLAGNFGDGKAVVRLPYTKAGNGNVKVMWLKDDGTTEPVASTYEDGFVKVELAHFSEYLVYTEPEVIVTGGGSASTYTVKFNTNGGSTIKSVSVNKNGVVAEPTAPTKKGYTFDGWYTDRQLTTPYDFTSKVTKNFTLFAKWIEDSKEPGTEEPGTEEPGTDVPTTVSFDDINETDWFYENVKYVVENKLMNGVSDTEFAPNNTLTRAMLVTVLYRNAGEPEVTEAASFADVDADSWYAKAVVWAEANGIVNGVSDTEFAPNANITREQIATIMYRYAQYNGDDVTAVADIEAYADAANVSDYAVDAMKYAVGSGLINGKTETTLNPQDNATRAEIATILKRFIEANAEVEEVVEETTEEVVEEATEETTEEVVEETTEETAE